MLWGKKQNSYSCSAAFKLKIYSNTLGVCICGALYLEVADMLEDKRVVDIYGLADLVVHCIDVGLVYSHALLSQG